MKLLLTVLALAWGCSARAAMIPTEDFFRPSALADPDLSPDGRRVAMVVREGWDARFAIVDRSGGKPAVFEGSREEWPAWIEWKTNDRLIYSVHQEQDGQLYGTGALYAINANGTKPRSLVDSLERQFRKRGEHLVEASLLDPLPRDPDHILVEADRYFLDSRHRLQAAQRPAVHRINIQSGAWQRVEEPFAKVVGWTSDWEGRVRLAWSEEADRVVIYHRAAGGTEWRELLSAKLGGRSLTPARFDPDGRRLYVFDDEGRKTAAVRVLDLTTGTLGPYVFEEEGYDLGSAVFGGGYGAVRFDRRRKVLAGLFTHTDKPKFFPADETARKLQAMIDQALPDTVNAWKSTSADGNVVVLHSFSDREAGAYYVFDLVAGKLSLLGRQRPWLKPGELAEMRPLAFPSRDGLTLHGYLTLPPESGAAGKPPLVVLPHGGPFVRDYWGYDPEVQFLANRGYAVLQVNFRGSAGFGSEFMLAGFREWGRKMQDDLTDGVKWAVAQGSVDGDRVGIYGGSYGGYAALAGLCFSPELYRCGASLCGVSDLRDLLRQDSRHRTALAREFDRQMLGDLKEDAEELKRYSPSRNAEKIRVPVLLAHGEDDRIVPIEQTEKIFRIIRQQAPDTQFIRKRSEGHGFRKRENVLEFYTALEKFLDQHLKHAQPRNP